MVVAIRLGQFGSTLKSRVLGSPLRARVIAGHSSGRPTNHNRGNSQSPVTNEAFSNPHPNRQLQLVQLPRLPTTLSPLSASSLSRPSIRHLEMLPASRSAAAMALRGMCSSIASLAIPLRTGGFFLLAMSSLLSRTGCVADAETTQFSPTLDRYPPLPNRCCLFNWLST